MAVIRGRQKGQAEVFPASGGGSGKVAAPASFSLMRLKAILHVRPVMGWVRTSTERSTAWPEGSTSRAVMVRLSNLRGTDAIFYPVFFKKSNPVLNLD